MQFLADENFPLDSIQLLKEKGFVVRSVFDVYRGKPDTFLLQEAVAAEEIILTFDKDFGELVFKSLIKRYKGVVFISHRKVFTRNTCPTFDQHHKRRKHFS